MAIREMVNEEAADQPNVETITDYPGHEVGWHHLGKCPLALEGRVTEARFSCCVSDCIHLGPLYMETSFTGCVLELRERNGYDDSDFLALVWDEKRGHARWIEYATTRAWCYPNSAQIDASPEIQAKYAALEEKYRREREQQHAETEARRPYKGREIEVTGGRKHKGKRGRIFWYGIDEFRTSRYRGERATAYRAGVETEEGVKFFVPEEYCCVLSPAAWEEQPALVWPRWHPRYRAAD